MNCGKRQLTQATQKRATTTSELEMKTTWPNSPILSRTILQDPGLDKIGSQGFALENDLPGAYLLQGFGAGIIAGFVYAAVMVEGTRDLDNRLLFTVEFMAFHGFVSTVIAILLRFLARRHTAIKRTPRRVFVSTLIFAVVGIGTANFLGKISLDVLKPLLTFIVGGGLTTGLLVGSNVRPWQLFTFGSIAQGQNKVTRRVSSNDLLVVLCCLPLRLVSILCCAFWILLVISVIRSPRVFIRNEDLGWIALFTIIPILYFGGSAYLTFRSPRKALLMLLCIALSSPVTFLLIVMGNEIAEHRFADYFIQIVIFFGFLLPWVLFLMARWSVYDPTDQISVTPIQRLAVGEEGCLGVQFADWQIWLNESS
jgi:hypothetical protein